MAPTISDIVRVSAQHKWSAQYDIVNVFHFMIVSPPTPNTYVNLMADFAEKFSVAWDEIKTDMITAVDPYLVEGFNITQDEPGGAASWPGPYTGGTATGDSMPTDDCALVLWRTGVKRKQGRTYLGPFTEARHINSLWDATLTAHIGAWAAVMRDEDPLTHGSEFRLGVYSRAGGTHSLITSVGIQPIVAQQERRKLGKGS